MRTNLYMSDQVIPELMYPVRVKIKNNFMDSIKLSREAVPTGLGFATRNYLGAQ